MVSGPGPAKFTVTNPHAPRQAVDPDIGKRAERLREDTSALTPVATGRLAASWQVVREGTAEYRVSTDVPYAVDVEYGTRNMQGAAMLGRSLAKARAGLWPR
jgi:hypothetical protein